MYDKVPATQSFQFLSKLELSNPALNDANSITPILCMCYVLSKKKYLTWSLLSRSYHTSYIILLTSLGQSFQRRQRERLPGIRPEPVRNKLPWKSILTPSLNDNDPRAHTLFLNTSRSMVLMTFTVSNRPLATLAVSCTWPDTAAFGLLVLNLRGAVSIYAS